MNEDYEITMPYVRSKCQYAINPNEKSPHSHQKANIRRKSEIHETILGAVGSTPLIRLNKLRRLHNLQQNIFAKCEFFNPGGSIKDRIAVRMMEEAEKTGKLKNNDIIIEPTSGNTGIGLAMTCAVKDYKCVIVMPERMSKEKRDVLTALGAEIHRTRSSAIMDDKDSHFHISAHIKHKINKKWKKDHNLPKAHILDQYRNIYNPLAHYDGTAEEILQQMGNNSIDMVVSGTGTGGTITGLHRKIKENNSKCLFVGVDPIGSYMAKPSSLNANDGMCYEIEGIGDKFIPTVLDHSGIDYWMKSNDKDSFGVARELIKNEGILCGGSSGAITDCAIKAIKHFKLPDNANIVIIFPDSIRNYLSKFVSDDWLLEKGCANFKDSELQSWKGTKLESVRNIIETDFICPNKTVGDYLTNNKVDATLLKVEADEYYSGVVTEKQIMENLKNEKINMKCLIKECMENEYEKVDLQMNLGQLAIILSRNCYAVVLDDHVKKSTTNMIGIIRRRNFLLYLQRRNINNDC
ncbi:hypothetical protein SNEBB_002930 [Seison nebaliae]|nr:hypothetical protein SNEBB_002930 [Seison nebaliae]